MDDETLEHAIDAQWRRADAEHRADCGDPDDPREDEFRARWELGDDA